MNTGPAAGVKLVDCHAAGTVYQTVSAGTVYQLPAGTVYQTAASTT